MGQPVKILIIDDHPVVRAGLRSLLGTDQSIEVVGEAEDGAGAVEAVARLQPAIVLMDIRMPHLDGLAATRAVKQAHPQVSVIMLTMQDDPNYLVEAIAAGAAGYLLKDAPRSDLLRAVRAVARGELFMDSGLMARSLQRLASATRPGGVAVSPLASLTNREREVLECIAQGMSNKEIASNLAVTVATAKTHVEHIIQKLEVSDRTQAAVLAVRSGLGAPSAP